MVYVDYSCMIGHFEYTASAALIGHNEFTMS